MKSGLLVLVTILVFLEAVLTTPTPKENEPETNSYVFFEESSGNGPAMDDDEDSPQNGRNIHKSTKCREHREIKITTVCDEIYNHENLDETRYPENEESKKQQEPSLNDDILEKIRLHPKKCSLRQPNNGSFLVMCFEH